MHPGCRAWAKKGQDLCASHSKRAGASGDLRTSVGAPQGNQNAIKHGFYVDEGSVRRPALTSRKPPLSPPHGHNGGEGRMTEIRTVPTLDDEIALLASRRDAVDRWMMARLDAGEEVDVLKYLALIGQIGSRIARMLKTRDALGSSGDVIEAMFSEVLDLLNDQVDVEV